MRSVVSKEMWAFLDQGDRNQVVEQIVHALIEEVENEQFHENSSIAFTTTGGGLLAAVQPAASTAQL